jgi:hypothetical protein
MRIIPPIANSIVGINITPRTITCSWIVETPDKSLPYALKAYKHVLFELHEKDTLTIFNPTRLRSLIMTFLQLHDLEDSVIIMALSGQGITEKQIMLTQPTAHLQNFEKDDLMAWHYFQLQENPNLPMSPWYCCGITRTLLLQYQLLSIQIALNLVQITTPTMALLKAYRFIKRHQPEDQGKPKTNILDFINLNGQLRVRSPNEHAAVVESFGLFLLGTEQQAA